MAFLKIGKKKREEPLDVPMPSLDMQIQPQPSPLEQVLAMKQQGYSSNQIVQTLQSQGYNNSQIYDAINQAGLASFQDVPQQPTIGLQDYGQSYEQTYQQQPFESFQPAKEMQTPLSADEERMR